MADLSPKALDRIREARAPLNFIMALLASCPDEAWIEDIKACDLYYFFRLIDEKLTFPEDES